MTDVHDQRDTLTHRPVTDLEHRQAVRLVCRCALDPDDALELLRALGLVPDKERVA